MSGSKNTILSTLRNAIALIWGLAIFGVIAWYLLGRAPEAPVGAPVETPATPAPAVSELAPAQAVPPQAVPPAAAPGAACGDDGTTLIDDQTEIAQIRQDPKAYVDCKTARILSQLSDIGMPADEKAFVENAIRLKVLAFAQTFYKYGTREMEPLDAEQARLKAAVDLQGQEISGWACAVDNFPAPLAADYYIARFRQKAETGLPYDPGEIYCNVTVLDPAKEQARRAAARALANDDKTPEHEIRPGVRIRAVLAEPVATTIAKIYNNDVVVLGGKVIATQNQSAETFGLENATLVSQGPVPAPVPSEAPVPSPSPLPSPTPVPSEGTPQ